MFTLPVALYNTGGRAVRLRLYLDNCCYNRPYDEQTQFKILMETRAKLHIQAENLDYTQWQRDYFDKKGRDELDREMEAYFASHPYRGDAVKII